MRITLQDDKENQVSFSSFVKQTVRHFTKKEFIAILGSLLTLSATVVGLLSDLESINIHIVELICQSQLSVFCLLALIGFLVVLLIVFCKNDNSEKHVIGTKNFNESIILLLDHSTRFEEYHYVIQLGTLLRQSPFIKSDNELRIKIGQTLAFAYHNLADRINEATTYIEDIGNSYLESGDVSAAIDNIQHGIEVVTKQCQKLPPKSDSLDDALYIQIRGYRNLANCYSYRAKNTPQSKESDKRLATVAIENAEKLVTQIQSEEKKLAIIGDLYYAQSKISQISKNWDNAIVHVQTSIDSYEKLRKQFSSDANKRKCNESVIKNYRELGNLYLQKEEYQEARDNLLIGLEKAKQLKDYENQVLIYLLYCRIEMATDPNGQQAKHFFDLADEVLLLVDSKKVYQEYYNVKKVFNRPTRKRRA